MPGTCSPLQGRVWLNFMKFFSPLTTNLEYQMKSNYKTTSTIPCVNRETNLMRHLTVWLEKCYCSITVENHQLITVIRFIAKNYTHPWKSFANRLYLVLHAWEILFSRNVREKNQTGHWSDELVPLLLNIHASVVRILGFTASTEVAWAYVVSASEPPWVSKILDVCQ